MNSIRGRPRDEMEFAQLNAYLSEEIRAFLEHNYYAEVERQANLDNLIGDSEFLADPGRHVGLYSDHGVVHVRDVARNIVGILDTASGVLIPSSDDFIRREGMKAYGVMLAYVHDIGMRDFSAFGRFMHPEFAAQEVFTPEFDEIFDVIWDDNCGNIAWGLVSFFEEGLLTQDPKLLLREMLAMSVAHSKSKVPMAVLNDPTLFRSLMKRTTSVNLHHLFHEQQVARAEQTLQRARSQTAGTDEVRSLVSVLQAAQAERDTFLGSDSSSGTRNQNVARFYDDFERDAFRWFTSDQNVIRLLYRDSVDVVRALRAADALRQRGTVLRTSGGYRISVDQNSARAVYTLRKSSGETFLVEGGGAIGAGEANVASSELSPSGDIWISFQRGAFASPETVTRAANNVAGIIDDIQHDIIDTFERPDADRTFCKCRTTDDTGLKSSQDIRIFLENTDDNLTFADSVKDALSRIAPEVGSKTEVMPSLKNIAAEERERYLDASALDWSLRRKELALQRIAQSGHKAVDIDPVNAFRNVRTTHLRDGEVLIKSDSPHGFVYVATNGKLLSQPRGGYSPFEIEAWSLIGRNSVITGDLRSDTNSALGEVDLLMIPKETYLKTWHHTYDIEEFIDVVSLVYQGDRGQERERLLQILEQVVMIDGQLAVGEIELIQMFMAAHGISQSTSTIESSVLSGGETDFALLRADLIDYLATNPSQLQVARFIDLLRLLVKQDRIVSAEEMSILAELDSLLTDYLDEESVPEGDAPIAQTRSLYQVLLVPQSTEQDREIRGAFEDAKEVTETWGRAFLVGAYYSEGFADLMAGRHRDLGFFAVIERTGG